MRKKQEEGREQESRVNGDLCPENNSIEKGLKKLPLINEELSDETELEIRDEKAFKDTLNTILSMVISPSTVAQAVKSTPLGEKITYQEAILIAQVLKASNGDTQAAVFIRDTSGNKLKDTAKDTEEKRTFESI